MTVSAPAALNPLLMGFGLLFTHNPQPMLLVERSTWRLLEGNAAMAQCLGFTHEGLPGRRLPELFYPQDWTLALEDLTNHPLVPESPLLHWRMRGHSGCTIDMEVRCEDAIGHGEPVCLLLLRDVVLELRQKLDCLVERVGNQQQRILDNLKDGFFHLDRESRFTFLNSQAVTLFRRSGAALLGRVIWDCYPLAFGTEHYRQFEQAMQSQEPASYETLYEPWQQWHEVRLFPSEQGMSVWFRDVTERHRTLQCLQQEREMLGAVVNSSSEAIICVDRMGRIQTLNPGAEQIFGVRSAEMLGQNVDRLLPERFRQAHALHRAAFVDEQIRGPRVMGLRMVKGLRSDGQELELEGSISHVTIDHRQLLIASLRDISHQTKLEHERQRTRNQLSRLTHRLMSQEKELVKRIAQALHDQLGQTVAAIRLVHETMGALRRGGHTAELEQHDVRLASLIDQAIFQVRRVLADLQPPMLDEGGLAAALDNDLRKRAGMPIAMQLVLQVPPELSCLRWPTTVEYAAFMIAREAVENAIRHSQATRLVLTLAGDATGLCLDIQDNGCGIQASPDAAPGKLGWASIQERANSIGARVSMGAAAGGGTCVSLQWQELP